VNDRREPLDQAEGFMVELTTEECWQLLARARFGRLAMSGAGEIDIFPIDFAVDGSDVVFRTTEGTKLVEVVLSDTVSLEADERDLDRGVAWSVVVKGTPELLETFEAIEGAENLDIQPWTGTRKDRFVRITHTRITGRRAYAPAAAYPQA
jgi:hypothetical protein